MNDEQFNRLISCLEGIQQALEKKSTWSSFKKASVPTVSCPKCNKSVAVRKDKNSESYYCWQKIGGCGNKGFGTKEEEKVLEAVAVPVEAVKAFPTARAISWQEQKKIQEEEAFAKASSPSPRAWIFDQSAMTREDFDCLNQILQTNGWAPLTHLPKWTREEFSIRFVEALTEDFEERKTINIPRVVEMLKQDLEHGSISELTYVWVKHLHKKGIEDL